MQIDTHKQEVDSGERFEFGKNWARFLSVLNDDRIALAERSLVTMLKRQRLDGLSFLDIGSGSGLFSLVARRLGATVFSFDYDPSSYACTQELRQRYFPNDPEWTVERGSVLDQDYLAKLGTFDIVYSWGVLHHTGQMWQALENVKPLVKLGGTLYIAIYNDHGEVTDRWAEVKRRYNRLSGPVASVYALSIIVREEALALKGYVRNGGVGAWVGSWKNYDKQSTRGMSKWHDWIDWIGGYPYERATVEKMVDFYGKDGFRLVNLTDLSHGYGCNEFVFTRQAAVGTMVDNPIPGGTSLVRRFGRRVLDISDGRGRIARSAPTGTHWLFDEDRLVGLADIDAAGNVTVPMTAASSTRGAAYFVVAGEVRKPAAPFDHPRGHMWSWSAPDLEAVADREGQPNASIVFVLEDARQLPHPHALHDAIATIGKGRFSHWGTYIYFAPTDNSDPNEAPERFSLFIPVPLE